MITVKCLQCSKEFIENFHQIKKGRRFCSRSCYDLYIPQKVTKKCLRCGTEFQTNPYEIKIGYGKYCCLGCRYPSLETRFWNNITKTGSCWLWTGGVERTGYGKIKNGGQTFGAHRISWIIHNGQIPIGMMVCHRCDNPPCVNPEHLFLGTAQDNMDDKISKGRQFVKHI